MLMTYDRMVDKTAENFASFQMQGSNWVFASIIHLEIYTVMQIICMGGQCSKTYLLTALNGWLMMNWMVGDHLVNIAFLACLANLPTGLYIFP